jgi:aryl-alcohol dehydrogenase-like predicted oxidoreductase
MTALTSDDPVEGFPTRTLGKTGLRVAPLGLAGGFGLSADDLVRAHHELGLNYFLVTPPLAEGIRRLVAGGHRERIVVASGAIMRTAAAVRDAWAAEAQALRVEVIDVWHLYYVRARFDVRDSLWSAMRKLKEEGRVRALAISCHDRALARRLVDDLELDVLMVRYNAAHRGAEQELFDTLPAPSSRPGVVAYTATRWGRLLKPVRTMRPMTAAECYRFALGAPQVDLVLCGARTYAELRENADGVRAGPLDRARLIEVRRLGDELRKGITGRIGFWRK